MGVKPCKLYLTVKKYRWKCENDVLKIKKDIFFPWNALNFVHSNDSCDFWMMQFSWWRIQDCQFLIDCSKIKWISFFVFFVLKSWHSKEWHMAQLDSFWHIGKYYQFPLNICVMVHPEGSSLNSNFFEEIRKL